MLTRGHCSGARPAAIAALLLALSPVFITYSSLVMSDVPTLFVTICAAVMLVLATSDYATQSPSWMRMSAWLIFGLFAGFSTIIRPTNATILAGLALCVVMVPLERRDLPSLFKAALAIAIGFAIPVAWQLHQNAINLGSAFASGYAWWVPEVYGAGGKTFSAAYLFGPTMPRNPHGNVHRVRHDAARPGRDARRSRRLAILPLSVRGGGVRDCRLHRDPSRAGKNLRRAA